MDNANEYRMSDEEVIAQISCVYHLACRSLRLTSHARTFVFGGIDTTSSALFRLLHLLAQHESVQAQLRKEIREARATYGELDYDQLSELPYLDAVCKETLRL